MAHPALDDLPVRLVGELDGVTTSQEGSRTAYGREGTVFARASPGLLELRLPPDIAEAALRTPDTGSVDGEPGWIRFRPRSTERHVTDRAEAWFRTAWRHAGPK